MLSRRLAVSFLAIAAASAGADEESDFDCQPAGSAQSAINQPGCPRIEEVSILGQAADVRDVAGGASVVSAEELQQFVVTDVVRAIRRVPGVSLQVEDGFGLRPNISIRGTATERSSRITLMEDGVLIAPATYAAPSAYYFPTFGRIYGMEVLKGPASITQGPYTVGGALNLISTPIPDERAGRVQAEYGSFDTWRIHAIYGDSGERASFMLETHQWQSDGYQVIDHSDSDTGLDKQDYLGKLRFDSDPGSDLQQSLEIKLQSSNEKSQQSYLGLTDSDFAADPLRRYGVSMQDEMDNDHQQIAATWQLAFSDQSSLSVTAYDNDFKRAWYKTDGVDFDGSGSVPEAKRSSWSSVIDAVNNSTSLGDWSPQQLQAMLDGADTPEGSILVRNNSREYYARGIQFVADHQIAWGNVSHSLQAGIRFHKDQEDRLQRDDSYQQLNGQLVLNDIGPEGGAGNRVQDAKALALYVQDRIEWQRWTFSPGLRYESIDLSRTDYDTSSLNPGSREPDNLKGMRRNEVDVWIPGMGLLYDLNDSTRLVAGVHKGFSTPGNEPGVNPEESINYELGLRFENDILSMDVMGFFNNYDNLVGVCTNSSGSDCEPGDSFNGEGVHIPGLELRMMAEQQAGSWSIPLQLTYTWMDATFQSGFDSEFFGEVFKGDPVPYVPAHQVWASVGLEKGSFSTYLSINYVGSVCTSAACGKLEETDAATLFDLAAHYQVTDDLQLYALVENLSDEIYIAGRQPYGARANKPRSLTLGVTWDF
jgi:Fe(3+) dicitrate transport protein